MHKNVKMVKNCSSTNSWVIREVNQGGQWSWAVNEARWSVMPVSEKPWLPGSIAGSSSLTVPFDWQTMCNEAGQSKFSLPGFIDHPFSLTAQLHCPPWLTFLIIFGCLHLLYLCGSHFGQGWGVTPSGTLTPAGVLYSPLFFKNRHVHLYGWVMRNTIYHQVFINHNS